MRASWGAVVAAFLCASLLTACGASDTEGTEDDCSAKLRIEDQVFRPVSGMRTPRTGEVQGKAEVIGCESDGPALGQVDVHAVEGEDPAEVLIVTEGDSRGVWLDDDIPWGERPPRLKDMERPVVCAGPAAFSGQLEYVVRETQAWPDPPYEASFTATSGTGLALEDWAAVDVRAQVTTATRPVPDGAFLDRAVTQEGAAGEPVEVTTTCAGKAFVVESIRFAEGP